VVCECRNKQLQALQEAFECCHAEMKSQREELCAQRREIESFFRAVPSRDFNMCDTAFTPFRVIQ
jgi:hypothetical protein